MAETLNSLNPEELIEEYLEMRETAPRRGGDGFSYFIERTGRPPQDLKDNRREERLAMALANDNVSVGVDGETVDVLMYAFPLYSSGGPRGIRAVDIVGHASETHRFWVVELKVAAKAGYGETPLRALYEALIYGSVVEANMAHIAGELARFGRKSEYQRPGLLIAAPEEYWRRWTPNERIGNWWSPYRSTADALSEQLETPLEIVSLGRVNYKADGQALPRVDGVLECEPVKYS